MSMLPIPRDTARLAFVVVLGVLASFFIYMKGQEPLLPAISLEPVSLTATTAPPAPAARSAEQSAFQFEVVTDTAEQERGLGGRPDVPENYGMLFVFPTDEYYGFWMKDMLVPIDMLWLSDTGTIVKIDSSVSPDTYPSVFYPPQPVRYVLETRAGEALRQGWSIGTHIALPLASTEE